MSEGRHSISAVFFGYDAHRDPETARVIQEADLKVFDQMRVNRLRGIPSGRHAR